MSNSKKDLSYFLMLPYSCEVIASEEGGFVVHHPDLVGCAAQGENVAEALENLSESRQLWLRAKWESDGAIPEPPTAEPSGRLMLRVPIRLHSRLEDLAGMYGKSLTRLLNEMLFNYVNALPADHGLNALAPGGEVEGSTADHYTYHLTPLPGGQFVAEHPDLPGCFSAGSDAIEAMANLDEAREVWIQGRQEEGLPVPKPLSAKHTGHIHLRIPPALHADLVRDAQRNGATLNQWLGFALAAASSELKDRRSEVVASARLRELRQQLYKELEELRIDVKRAFIEKLKPEYVFFLLGLLYLKKESFEKASILFFSATQGDFIPEEMEDVFSFLRNDLVGLGLDLAKAALPVAHSFPQVTEEDEVRRSVTIRTLQQLGEVAVISQIH